MREADHRVKIKERITASHSTGIIKRFQSTIATTPSSNCNNSLIKGLINISIKAITNIIRDQICIGRTSHSQIDLPIKAYRKDSHHHSTIAAAVEANMVTEYRGLPDVPRLGLLTKAW